jgi:polynucleotide 5'-hydroxyl-kinase GRC3/NOL9
MDNNKTPAASYFIGDTSPSTDPARYLCSITNLYEWYCTHGSTIGNTTATKATTLTTKSKKGSSSSAKKSQLAPSPPPLIVNTHGWVKGFGFDLIVDTLRMLSPTHYVHILHSNPRRNLPQGVFWAVPPPPPPPIVDGGEGQGASQQQIMPVMFDVPALDPPTIGSIGSTLQRGRETAAGPSGSGHESDITAAAA